VAGLYANSTSSQLLSVTLVSGGSGWLYGAGAILEYRWTPTFSVGVFGELTNFSGGPSSSGVTNPSAGVAIVGRTGRFSASLGFGYASWSSVGDHGITLVSGADFTLLGPLSVHVQAALSTASPSGTTQLFYSAAGGVGFVY